MKIFKMSKMRFELHTNKNDDFFLSFFLVVAYFDYRSLGCELSLSRRIPPTPCAAWLANFDAYKFASS